MTLQGETVTLPKVDAIEEPEPPAGPSRRAVREWLDDRTLRSRQISPLLTALPLGLLGSVILFDIGALMSGNPFFADVAYWVLTIGLVAGLLVDTVLLVNITSGPVGLVQRRVLGVVSGAMTGMITAFALVWWLRTDGAAGGNLALLLVELVAYGAGIAGASYGGRPTERRSLDSPTAGLPFFTVPR